jgi:hypothetical protein
VPYWRAASRMLSGRVFFRSMGTRESPPFDGLSANRGGEIRTRDLLNPMPIPCADQRCWALIYAGFGVSDAGGQQPAAVGAVTDADTVRNA